MSSKKRHGKTPQVHATHQGVLSLGEIRISCAVLSDGRRVLTASEVQRALGRHRSANARNLCVAELPPFLAPKNLKPFIPEELRLSPNTVSYLLPRSGVIAHGYEASLLPAACRVYLDARRASALRANQSHIAERAEILLGALATIGIHALIDEATGYQYERPRDDLHRILERYISKELMPWQKRFPDEFYEEIYRLLGWSYDPGSHKHPQCVGAITNEIVYSRLEPGVLDELRRINPADDDGNRSHRHHQFLTESVGHKALERQLTVCLALLKAANSWSGFKIAIDRVCPRTIPRTRRPSPGASESQLDLWSMLTATEPN